MTSISMYAPGYAVRRKRDGEIGEVLDVNVTGRMVLVQWCSGGREWIAEQEITFA